MRMRLLLLLLIVLPLVGQTDSDDQQRQIDSLRTELQETQAILDLFVSANNPIDLGERMTDAFQKGTNMARFTLWFVSIIGGLLGIAGAILGFLGFKEIRQVKKIRDEAQAAKVTAEDHAEKTEECAKKAEDLLQKLEDRIDKYDKYEPRIESVESKVKPDYISGIMALDEKNYEEALKHFEKAITEEPQNAVAFAAKGFCLSELGRYEEALKVFDEAISLNPTNPETHFNRGVVLDKLGKYENAIEAYEEALKFDPEYWSAHQNKACSLGDWGVMLCGEEAIKKFELAIKSAEKAIEHSKGKRGFYNLACAQAMLGEFSKSLDSLQKSKDSGELADAEELGPGPWRDHPFFIPLQKGKWRKRFIEIVGPPPGEGKGKATKKKK